MEWKEKGDKKDLKIVGAAPVEDFAEEIPELAEGEEQAVAEVGGQRGEIRNGDHGVGNGRDLDSEFGNSFRGAAAIGDPNPSLAEPWGRERGREKGWCWKMESGVGERECVELCCVVMGSRWKQTIQWRKETEKGPPGG